MQKYEIPTGLDKYEFLRDLNVDLKHPLLWHFVPRLAPNTKKPMLSPDNLPHKPDFKMEQLFDNNPSYLELEIGSGKGGFLKDYALQNPEIQVLGTEWDYGCARFTARRLEKHQVSNARILRGDTFFILRDLVPDNCIDAAHMYFPDPWPKKRHQKNRLLRPDFLQEISRVLKPGKCKFYWGTDHQEYNEIALEHFAKHPGAKILEKNTASPTGGITTLFEQRFLQEGLPIYRSIIEFSK